ncbi:imidazole glycerol phosphate synthase subunit HisH [Ameyamaea chiangmaiensis NBRC 103196]|uniref:Imidazole glycerol phosphate synthase subunit HisH n=1 Tax=Ameyamaea chiangmaiensis TaxID=442969 RepID=A0A850PI94_9PROT|nr:imidazole glycerol phosphate synthase subunit HisH [Ameyamaea chiangmaiensis]MBS4074765.1 imidazole glycerol phosphate synthase subunit HisH [Ameyamaea chiangmaiensis]NVN42120.1 imidazole glycerol phosphate synthase subunit HisH [Ameyamaea chiangmaiensis]GBQ62658.1 imidazole glycerol phosphate synthase subunit HisH [Ameyamaea chiangmaiensis NBRC 103196]
MARRSSIVVIDYNGGNLASAAQALTRAAFDSGIDADVTITADPDAVRAADRIVLPGQGAFADCAAGIANVPGLRAIIEEQTAAGVPFLGICVGMQLMAERGLEFGETPGFCWIRGEIAPMEAPGLRLPQMGWNQLSFTPGAHPLTEGLAPDAHVYFVHSYALRGHDTDELVATTEYGGAVPAIVARGNRAGTQFHVEKSQRTGLRILANFLRWTPAP